MKEIKLDQDCCSVFHALSDQTRMSILKLLSKGEMCVSDIASHFDMTQPSISHHLDILKRSNLVSREKKGREVYYSYNDKTIVECCGRQFKALDIEVKKA